MKIPYTCSSGSQRAPRPPLALLLRASVSNEIACHRPLLCFNLVIPKFPILAVTISYPSIHSHYNLCEQIVVFTVSNSPLPPHKERIRRKLHCKDNTEGKAMSGQDLKRNRKVSSVSKA